MGSECEAWIKEHGSGSLLRALQEGMSYHDMYLHERVAFEVGAGFHAYPASRLLLGKAVASPDCPATTETCWYARVLRWRWRHVPHMTVQVQYAHLTEEHRTVEGLGIVVTGLNLSWLPAHRVLFAMTSIYDPKDHVWSPVENPC
jgi:hypothetical protein